MKRDVDYIVKDGEIIIVDEFTGRLMYGRRFSTDYTRLSKLRKVYQLGPESKTLATITLKLLPYVQEAIWYDRYCQDRKMNLEYLQYGRCCHFKTNKPIANRPRRLRCMLVELVNTKLSSEKLQEAHETGQPVLMEVLFLLRYQS